MLMETENYSVVIIDHDDPQLLERALQRAFLYAEENAQGEVIVVVAKGKKESDSLLERMSPQHPELRVTFVPDSSRRMDGQKIALTLGVKAASYDRVVVIDTLTTDFSPFNIFVNQLRHRRLIRHTLTGIDFENAVESISLSKTLFLQREHFDENLMFVYNCYHQQPLLGKGMWLIRLKYLLAKCHLYHL
jgi:hypothetical protein